MVVITFGPGTNEFNFCDDPDHRPDPGVQNPKSAFTGLSKKLPTDFDYILVMIRITIRIREEMPQFYYAGVRRRSELSGYF